MASEPDDARTTKTVNTDDRLEQWKRSRDAAQYENQRMHDRFNWLMISQPVLFTALAFSLKEHRDCSSQNPGLTESALNAAKNECERLSSILDKVELLTIGLGLTISSLVLVGLVAAGRKHWQWTSRLNKLASELNASDNSDPIVTFGSEPYWPARTTSLIAPALAFAFTGAWLYLTRTLPDQDIRLCILGTDAMMLLFVLSVSIFSPAWRRSHYWRALKKST